MSNTPSQLPEGFVQRADFVSAEFGPYNEFLPDLEPAAEQLVQQGVRVLLHISYWNYHTPPGLESNTNLQTNPNLIYLVSGREFLETAVWMDVLQVVANGMNKHRQAYNHALNNLFRVERLKIHHSPITLTSSKINAEPMPIIITSGNTFTLVCYKPGYKRFIETPWHGYCTRWSRDKKILFGEYRHPQKDTIYFEIKVSPTVKPPLSMLTPQNVFEEKVLVPEVFFREPTVS
ncbi:TPA: hypothetical protein DIC39_03565 [Patescibacteria group bacterium]|nr:hypothetical protein [Patescibacteria group bacterium]